MRINSVVVTNRPFMVSPKEHLLITRSGAMQHVVRTFGLLKKSKLYINSLQNIDISFEGQIDDIYNSTIHFVCCSTKFI